MLNDTIRQSVDDAIVAGLRGAGLTDTPQNRIIVMRSVHDQLAGKGNVDEITNLFLLEIENQVKALEQSISN